MAIELALLSAQVLSPIIKQTFENLQKAKKQYQDTVPQTDLTSLFERKRQELLGSLLEIQTQIMLYVSNRSTTLRLITVLTDLMTQAYEAKLEQELTMCDLSLGQIKGVLEQYKQLADRRASARWYAIIASIFAIVGLSVVMFFGTFNGGPSVNTVLPIIEVPLPILIWSAIGSFTSILYRFNNSGDMGIQDPIRWLFTRPLTGIVMGIVAYFVVLTGLLAIGSQNPSLVPINTSTLGSTAILWLVAFIAGFSDRFADGILKTLVGRFGGKENEDLVSLDTISTPFDLPEMTSLVENLPMSKRFGKKQNSSNGNTKRDEKETSSSTQSSEIKEPERPIINSTQKETSEQTEPSPEILSDFKYDDDV